MCLLFFFAFTLVELIIVIAIIAILLAIVVPNLVAARRPANCVKLAAEIHKELTDAEETAKKLYDGDSSVNDTQLDTKLGKVTEKLQRLYEHCRGKDYSAIICQIDSLTAQLTLYRKGDSSPAEKSALDVFIDLFDALKKKLTK